MTRGDDLFEDSTAVFVVRPVYRTDEQGSMSLGPEDLSYTLFAPSHAQPSSLIRDHGVGIFFSE